jgi:membrane protein implicated in regulation of membrane protease activity
LVTRAGGQVEGVLQDAAGGSPPFDPTGLTPAEIATSHVWERPRPGATYAGRVTEPTTPEPRMRIRWGWIIGCIVLGLAGIAAGFLLVASADRTAYVASVLAGVGTTLLLVGIVVLLERRIVDSVAKAVRRAVDAEREASDARIEQLVGDLEDRLSAEWARTGAADVDAMKRRTAELTDETVERIVDEAKGLAEESKRHAE